MTRLRLVDVVETLPRGSVVVACCVFVAAVGVIDWATGGALVLSVFYVAPVALTTWVFGRRVGIGFAVVATLLWTAADKLTLLQAWTSAIPWWNAGVRLAFFVFVVLILAALRQALRDEQRLARLDPLTTVANLREFEERGALELQRARRDGTAITLACMDVDDLKAVNDGYGHQAGDALLTAVAGTWRRVLRSTDLVARVGGDEFAVLLPATGLEEARVALSKGREATRAAITAGGWPASVSIGAVTSRGSREDIDALMRRADALMYDVKSGGKDGMRCEELPVSSRRREERAAQASTIETA